MRKPVREGRESKVVAASFVSSSTFCLHLDLQYKLHVFKELGSVFMLFCICVFVYSCICAFMYLLAALCQPCFLKLKSVFANCIFYLYLSALFLEIVYLCICEGWKELR